MENEKLVGDMFMAQRACFVALVTALHKANVLPIGDVVNQLERTYDFATAAHQHEKNPLTEAMIDSLRAIEAALALKSQPPQAPSGDE